MILKPLSGQISFGSGIVTKFMPTQGRNRNDLVYLLHRKWYISMKAYTRSGRRSHCLPWVGTPCWSIFTTEQMYPLVPFPALCGHICFIDISAKHMPTQRLQGQSTSKLQACLREYGYRIFVPELWLSSQAICNFANKMPDGSYFITFGQGLPDHLTFGLNRHPDQRRAVAVKKAEM